MLLQRAYLAWEQKLLIKQLHIKLSLMKWINDGRRVTREYDTFNIITILFRIVSAYVTLLSKNGNPIYILRTLIKIVFVI